MLGVAMFVNGNWGESSNRDWELYRLDIILSDIATPGNNWNLTKMRFVFHYLSYRESRKDLQGSGRQEIAEQQWRWQRDESNAPLLVRGLIKFWTNLSQLVIWLLPCKIVSAHLCGRYTRLGRPTHSVFTPVIPLHTSYSMYAILGVAGGARR